VTRTMSRERKVKRLKGINLLHPPLMTNMLGSWNLSEEQFHAHFVAVITIVLQYAGSKRYTEKRSWRQGVRQDKMMQHCRSRRICVKIQRNQDKSLEKSNGDSAQSGQGFIEFIRAKNTCSHCQRNGHCEDSCWKLHPGLRRSTKLEGPEQKRRRRMLQKSRRRMLLKSRRRTLQRSRGTTAKIHWQEMGHRLELGRFYALYVNISSSQCQSH
jgi:hypothetical protein